MNFSQWFCDLSFNERYSCVMIADRNIRNRLYSWFQDEKVGIKKIDISFGDLQGRKVLNYIRILDIKYIIYYFIVAYTKEDRIFKSYTFRKTSVL